jgi:hypothetical protein
VLDLVSGGVPSGQDVRVTSLPKPPASDRPLSVYGLLKPRQLALVDSVNALP